MDETQIRDHADSTVAQLGYGYQRRNWRQALTASLVSPICDARMSRYKLTRVRRRERDRCRSIAVERTLFRDLALRALTLIAMATAQLQSMCELTSFTDCGVYHVFPRVLESTCPLALS